VTHGFGATRFLDASDSSALRDIAGQGSQEQGVTNAVEFSPDSQIGALIEIWRVADGTLLTSSCSLSTVTQSLALDVSPDRTKLIASGGSGSGGSGFWIFPL
jgi:hypothetical protein